MKNLIQLLIFIPIFTFGQSKNWVNNPLNERAFVKNEGQFNGRNWDKNSNIAYAVNENPFYIFFTKKGLTYRFDKMIKLSDKDNKNDDDAKRTNISELVRVNWIGANKNVQIIANEKTSNYFSYASKILKPKKLLTSTTLMDIKKLPIKIYIKILMLFTHSTPMEV